MNQVSLHGRLTKDPDIRTAKSGKLVARFFLAVGSTSKDAQGNFTTDFIPCVMFGKKAETARTYLRKGSEIAASGMIHTGKYAGQDGKNRYTFDVWINDFDFCGKKTDSNAEPLPPAAAEIGQQIQDDDIPF